MYIDFILLNLQCFVSSRVVNILIGFVMVFILRNYTNLFLIDYCSIQW